MNVCGSKDSLSFPRPLASTRVSLIKHNFNIVCNTLQTYTKHKKQMGDKDFRVKEFTTTITG